MVNRTAQIRKNDILALVTMRNERVRLPFFLNYYRNLGVNHFLFVNNDSDDGSGNYLAEQPDVSLWWTNAGYKRSRFGMDWINRLLAKYGHGIGA